MTPASRVRALGYLALLVALAVGLTMGWGNPHWYDAPLLALVVCLAEIAAVPLSFGRQRWTFSLTEAGIAAALVSSPRAWVIVGVSVGVVLARLVRRHELLKVQFSAGQFAAATALAAAVADVAGGGVLGAVAGMSAFWLVNTLLIAGVTSFTSGEGLGAQLRAGIPLSVVHSAGTSSIGVLAAWLAERAPLGLLALVVPLFLLWLSYDEQSARAAEATLFADLARLQEQASNRSVDVSAQVVLTAAARLYGGADVEMVLMSEEGAVHYVGDEAGLSRRRVDADVLDAPWVLNALGAEGPVTGVQDGRPWCATSLGCDGAPTAVLLARRPSGSSPFGRREATLTDVLVTQAESWLSIASLAASRDEALAHVEAAEGAARALGDLGADTAPSLVVLRESANRLARLAATGGPASVQEIVGELYAVERAVASLLGAIALAAEPELGRFRADDVSAEVTPVRDEWTTTGVLSS